MYVYRASGDIYDVILLASATEREIVMNKPAAT